MKTAGRSLEDIFLELTDQKPQKEETDNAEEAEVQEETDDKEVEN